MTRGAAIALLAAAAAAAGCNDDPRVSSTDKARTTTEALLKLCAEGNGPGVYDTLAQDARRRFIQAGGVLDGCEEVVGLARPQGVSGLETFARARVVELTRVGDQARATVKVGDEEATVTLLDTGLEWFVAGPPRYEPVGTDDLP